jgi:hypothetical protein
MGLSWVAAADTHGEAVKTNQHSQQDTRARAIVHHEQFPSETTHSTL